LKIKFIGTGSGLTSLKRFHSSFIIYSFDYKLLIDAGDGISKALLLQNISFNEINGLLISHLHPDHFSGLAALLVQMKLTGRKNELDIFINQTIIEFIKKYILQSYIFVDKMGFDINFKPYSDDENVNITEKLSFYAKQNGHLDKYKLYDKSGNIKFSCNSFLFRERDKSVFYSGDIGDKKDLLLFDEFNFNTMIVETSHVSLDEIWDIYRQRNLSNLIFTHISDEDESRLQDFIDSLKNVLGKNVFVAKDGDLILV